MATNYAARMKREALQILRGIRDQGHVMPPPIVRILIAQVLVYLDGIHTLEVKDHSTIGAIRIPPVDDKVVERFQQAIDGDNEPILRWLSQQRVPYDPRLINEVIPE